MIPCALSRRGRRKMHTSLRLFLNSIGVLSRCSGISVRRQISLGLLIYGLSNASSRNANVSMSCITQRPRLSFLSVYVKVGLFQVRRCDGIFRLRHSRYPFISSSFHQPMPHPQKKLMAARILRMLNHIESNIFPFQCISNIFMCI